MKSHAEMDEGPQAYERFRKAMQGILKVPHSVIQERIAQHRKEAALNPRKRGPKPKPKPSASDPVAGC
jgi:hypothetical protein